MRCFSVQHQHFSTRSKNKLSPCKRMKTDCYHAGGIHQPLKQVQRMSLTISCSNLMVVLSNWEETTKQNMYIGTINDSRVGAYNEGVSPLGETSSAYLFNG